MASAVKKIPIYIFLGLIIFFSTLMLRIILPYFSFKYDVDFLLTKQSVLHLKIWRLAFYTHISSSMVVLLFGGFQFSKSLIFGNPKIHRLLGKIYVFLVLGIAAPSGLIMAFYANGGIWAKTSFVTISILWWFFTFKAFRNALDKNFKTHLGNMYRSYALTLSAITLRLYALILPHLILLHAKEMYTLIALLSWIPNLAVAEYLIRKQKLI
jgi:hypothetical protein